MLTTGIVEMDEQSRNIVETAAKLDIKYIKLGYWPYKGFGYYEEDANEVKKALAQLEPLFRDNGVKAGFHNHSLMNMGLNANHVLRLIEDCNPEVIGVYYDAGHSTIEGSGCGWMRKMVPLESGLTDWPAFIECLKQMKFNGPISFHSEYQGSHSWRDLSPEDVVGQTARDLSYFRSLMGK